MSSSIDIFNQVTFVGIQECYYSQKDVNCHFVVSPVLKPDVNDSVGIYKVGWKSTKEFICCKAVAVPSDFPPETSLEACVVFTAAELPEDTGDFYQFCYVSHADQRTHGISTPFQLSADESAVDWEIVGNENVSSPDETELSQQEPSIVVVDDSEQHMPQQNENEAQSVHSEEQIEILKQELHAKNEELTSVIVEKEKYAAELLSRNELEASVDQLQKRCDDAATKCQSLALDVETKEAKLKRQEENEQALQKQLADAVTERDKYLAELSDLKQKHQSDVDEIKRQKEDMEAEMTQLKVTLGEKEAELRDVQEAQIHGGTVIHDLQEQLNAEKAKFAELEDEMKTYTVLRQMVSTTGRVSMSHRGTVTRSNASEEPADARVCPMCEMQFPDDEHELVIQAHVLGHIARFCPVCDKEFPIDDQRSFDRHVEACLRAPTQEL